jgi:hypothetical protein
MEVTSLKEVEFWETNDPSICAIRIIDSENAKFSVATNSSGIAAFVGKLMAQATHPAFVAASLQTDQIRQCQIGGSRIELKSGRSPTEVAATVTIGCIQLIVFLPLPEVIRACAELAERIEPQPPEKPH